MAQTMFKVHGPFKVPTYKGKSGRAIRTEESKCFWDEHSELANRIGCYVFAIKASGGLKPWYVGKATKSFAGEVFASDKRNKYHECLTTIGRGTPIIYLLEYPKKKGIVRNKNIAELEIYLIQNGVAVNADLLNVHGKKKPKWGIGGILRSHKGLASLASDSLKRTFKFSRK